MITVDSSSREPAYAQIYRALRSDLEQGAYRPGDRLPSIRTLATELSVSRNTIARAYDQLYAEGYIVGRDRSGYFVDPHLDEVTALLQTDAPAPSQPASRTEVVETPEYDFSYGTLSDALFPLDGIRKAAAIALATPTNANAYSDPFGLSELRANIASNLLRRRGIACSPDQIIVLSSTRDGLDHIAKLFDPASDTVGIEQPGWPGASQAFENNRFAVRPIPVSSSQAFFDALGKASPKLLYTTPSHQFPTGKVMPYSRRVQLLEWAQSHESFVIEDDYDGEYRYGQLPIPSLQSVDSTDRVIYSGTLSKVFSPGLRLSYLVLPWQLLDRYREKLSCYWCSVPWLVQNIVNTLFDNGSYDRQIRKQVSYFRKSQSLLLGALNALFGDEIEVSGEHAGLHIWVRAVDGRDSHALARRALDEDVGIYPATQYWLDQSAADASAFILGYSHIEQSKIEPGVALLRKAWQGRER